MSEVKDVTNAMIDKILELDNQVRFYTKFIIDRGLRSEFSEYCAEQKARYPREEEQNA